MDAIMGKTFPQQFFIPDIYPEQIPTLVFESDEDLLNWISENKGGYDFTNFIYTAIRHAVYNSFNRIEICRFSTPSVKLSMSIPIHNYSVSLSKLIELAIESEYYELCSEIAALIKLIDENKNYFE